MRGRVEPLIACGVEPKSSHGCLISDLASSRVILRYVLLVGLAESYITAGQDVKKDVSLNKTCFAFIARPELGKDAVLAYELALGHSTGARVHSDRCWLVRAGVGLSLQMGLVRHVGQLTSEFLVIIYLLFYRIMATDAANLSSFVALDPP